MRVERVAQEKQRSRRAGETEVIAAPSRLSVRERIWWDRLAATEWLDDLRSWVQSAVAVWLRELPVAAASAVAVWLRELPVSAHSAFAVWLHELRAGERLRRMRAATATLLGVLPGSTAATRRLSVRLQLGWAHLRDQDGSFWLIAIVLGVGAAILVGQMYG
jgi:hypothetical protein